MRSQQIQTVGRSLPAAPGHLSRERQVLWRATVSGYELEPHHLELLRLLCEALDRAEQARQAIEAEGAYVEGRFGLKAHPAVAVERDSRLAAARLLRALDLEDEPGVVSPLALGRRRGGGRH